MKRLLVGVALALGLLACTAPDANGAAVCQRINSEYGFGWDKEQLAQCKELHGKREGGERRCVDGCLVATNSSPFKQCYETCIGPIRPTDLGLGKGSYAR